MNLITKIKELLLNDQLFYALLILVVAIVAFGLGRLSNFGTQSISTTEQAGAVSLSQSQSRNENISETPATTEVNQERSYVASKNSTKYHLPWCSGAQRIAEENKIWFATKEEAEASGRTPAANCKGL